MVEMELIERYIYAVGRYLPRAKRADVQAELRSLLLDALEARGEGGEVTEEEVVKLLKEMGRPAQVAAGYAPSRQYLIGPRFYPAFATVVKVGLSLLVLLHLFAYLLQVSQGLGGWPAVVPALGDLWGTAVGFVGTTLVVFAILERLEVDAAPETGEWDPRRLPKVATGKEVDRADAVFEIAFSLIGLGLMAGYAGREGVNLFNHPALRPYVIAGATLLVLDAVTNLYLLYKGAWSGGLRLAMIGLHALWLALLVLVGRLDWPAIIADLTGIEGLAPLGRFMPIGLAVAGVIIAVTMAQLVYAHLRHRSETRPGKGFGLAPADK
jgi:hypothetical protein